MSKQDAPGTDVVPAQEDRKKPILADPKLLAQFAEKVTIIPAEDDGAMDRIMAQVLSATSWEDLDKPWEATKVKDIAGRTFVLHGAKRRPSDFRDGLGMFLVLSVTDVLTGKDGVIITGSAAVIGQIVQAYVLNALPLLVEFVVAERPSQDGYHPHHLKVHGTRAVTDSERQH